MMLKTTTTTFAPLDACAPLLPNAAGASHRAGDQP